jgi:excisionase family DNA binding protein
LVTYKAVVRRRATLGEYDLRSHRHRDYAEAKPRHAYYKFTAPRMSPTREGTMSHAEPLTYSVDEVAELLGIARGVAYECVRNGSIPATRVGRRWLVPRKRFHAWLDGTSTTPTDGRGGG